MDIYLDNIVFYLQKAGGISAYWYELISRLLATNHRSVLIEPAESSENIFRRQLGSEDTILKKTLWPAAVERYLPIRINIDRPTIVHSSYYRIAHHRNAANVVTVHDFTYEFYRTGLPRHVHHWQKRHAILCADAIVCVSQHTKSDLQSFFPEAPEDKIWVIGHGVSDAYYPLQLDVRQHPQLAHVLGTRYVLYVGDRRGYKNFPVAVEAVARDPELYLVIAGGGDLEYKETQLLAELLGGRFYYVGAVSNETLNILYNCAFCLIHPSGYEGFGMPVLEALRAGCPVVALCQSSLPEICGGACVCVDKADPGAFYVALKALYNTEYRDGIIARGNQQAKRFSWETCVAETLNVYHTIYEKRFGLCAVN